MDNAFLDDRITATKVQIITYEDAALAISNGVLSYTFDSGQTKQTVTRQDLASLQRTITSLYNRLATLEARRGRGGTVTGRPAW